MRNIQNLNEAWIFVRAENPTEGEKVQVTLPHTWNNVDGQDGGDDYHRGKCWYIRNLDAPDIPEKGRAYLEFEGAAMTAEVYLNGELLATHEGGYSTFRVDVTNHLKQNNVLSVAVSNARSQSVYPQKADFTFYGGLYRDVNLIVVPESHFCLDYHGGSGVKITPVVNLEQGSAVVTAEAWVTGPAEQVMFSLAGQEKEAQVTDGYAKAEFTIENVHLWDGVDDPYLYTATATLPSGDEVTTRFGCRKFEIDPQKGFLLNGRSYPLRGVSRHQDRKGAGSALTAQMMDEDMEIIKELGANTLRLAHYQHAQYFYDLCDENGIVVWAEIPYITMHMQAGRENTLSQMAELVVQNYNHPSIAVWGLSNEITAASPVNEELMENHQALHDLCHKLDATRPTTMANVFMLDIDSPILEIPDVNSYNLYFGWYLGELEQNDQFFDEYHEKFPNRAIGFSEYGADANPAYHSSNPEKGDYTESYQCVYHEHMLRMIQARPWLWATHVWNLFDFGADGRDEGGKHGENQKGLVTFDRSLKKDAFYLYKAAWNKKEPFVHLCGSRYVDRPEDVTQVKVYSNQSKVELYLDGTLFETKEGETVFTFEVPISGEHTIQAQAEGCVSVMVIRKVEQPNPAYTRPGRASVNVTNWFDQGEADPTCYSIMDTLGEIRQSPQAGKIIDEMMAKGADSHGEVAETVKDNPALQRMMNRITLVSLLKQAGADEQSMKQLNRILQGIKKEGQA